MRRAEPASRFPAGSGGRRPPRVATDAAEQPVEQRGVVRHRDDGTEQARPASAGSSLRSPTKSKHACALASSGRYSCPVAAARSQPWISTSSSATSRHQRRGQLHPARLGHALARRRLPPRGHERVELLRDPGPPVGGQVVRRGRRRALQRRLLRRHRERVGEADEVVQHRRDRHPGARRRVGQLVVLDAGHDPRGLGRCGSQFSSLHARRTGGDDRSHRRRRGELPRAHEGRRPG